MAGSFAGSFTASGGVSGFTGSPDGDTGLATGGLPDTAFLPAGEELATTTWDGTFPIGYASIGAGVGRLTLTSDVAGGVFQIHFMEDGGRVDLTVDGSAGDYILFQTQ